MTTIENIKILVTDDDQDDREFFAAAVEDLNLNHPVEFCKNGLELLDRLYDGKSEIPDIIFLDLNMPILSGFETLQQIRENDKFKDIPVIAIYSTSATKNGIATTFKLGANAYVVKPISFNDLKKLVKKVLDTNWKEKMNCKEIESFLIMV